MEKINRLKFRIEMIIQESQLSMSYIFEKIFTSELALKEFNFPEKYPHMYDGDKFLFENKDRKVEHSFCPFHEGQTTGDAFAIFNDNKGFFCYNTSCTYSGRPLNVLELIMASFLDVDVSRLYDTELSWEEVLKAGDILVDIVGKEIGINKKMFNLKIEKDPIEKIYEDAANYYHFLATESKRYVKDLEKFLKNRGFDNGVFTISELIKEFKLGITPLKGDMLTKFLLKSHKKEDILKSRLSVERNGDMFDFFRNRAIIPYMNNGKVIGFYGRDLNPNGDRRWRHMRLEGTVEVPNGIYDILKSEEFILTEGEFSNIAVKALGFSNTMETRGTNGLRDEHIELIKRVRDRNPEKCRKCYFAFDPDEAGESSVLTLGKKLMDIGIEVKVIRLPDGLDPNDLLTEYKKEAKGIFENLLEEAMSYDAFFLIKNIKREDPKDPSELRMFFSRFSEKLDEIPKIERAFIAEEFLLSLDTIIPKQQLRDHIFNYWVNV